MTDFGTISKRESEVNLPDRNTPLRTEGHAPVLTRVGEWNNLPMRRWKRAFSSQGLKLGRSDCPTAGFSEDFCRWVVTPVRKAMATTFSFFGGAKVHASDEASVLSLINRLTISGASLLTNPEGFEGYLDFHVLEDGTISMEIMQGSGDDFAIVDIPKASRVLEIALGEKRDLPLRPKLDGIAIRWLT